MIILGPANHLQQQSTETEDSITLDYFRPGNDHDHTPGNFLVAYSVAFWIGLVGPTLTQI